MSAREQAEETCGFRRVALAALGLGLLTVACFWPQLWSVLQQFGSGGDRWVFKAMSVAWASPLLLVYRRTAITRIDAAVCVFYALLLCTLHIWNAFRVDHTSARSEAWDPAVVLLWGSLAINVVFGLVWWRAWRWAPWSTPPASGARPVSAAGAVPAPSSNASPAPSPGRVRVRITWWSKQRDFPVLSLIRHLLRVGGIGIGEGKGHVARLELSGATEFELPAERAAALVQGLREMGFTFELHPLPEEASREK